MKFFGWRMVFTGLTVEFTVIGFLFYSFPVIWPYLISELGMTESQLGMIKTAATEGITGMLKTSRTPAVSRMGNRIEAMSGMMETADAGNL